MDTLRLELTDGGPTGPGMRYLINDADLLGLVKTVEQPFADAEDHSNIAGSYGALPHSLFVARRDDFMGLGARWPGTGRVVLYVCGGCGEEGCWPLLTDVSVDASTVTWRNFQQPYRSETSVAGHWDLSRLGPFVFDRAAYEAELDAAGGAPT
jgi:hypothetical protein